MTGGCAAGVDMATVTDPHRYASQVSTDENAPQVFSNRFADAIGSQPGGPDRDQCRCVGRSKATRPVTVSFHKDTQDHAAESWQRLLALIDEAVADGRTEFAPRLVWRTGCSEGLARRDLAQERPDRAADLLQFGSLITRPRTGSLPDMATHWTLGCDAADPSRLAAFWALALGYVDEPGHDFPDGASIVDPDGKGPAIGFLRVPEPKTAKNRMHIDVRVAGEPPWDMAKREHLIRAKVTELTAAGATVVREESDGGVLGHVVMYDPEGNEFCVA